MTHWTEETFVEQSELFVDDLLARVDDADDEVEALLALLADEHDRHPETALDAACGVGRHAVALADRGLDVVGVDLSADYVGRARERASERGVADRVEFRQGDVRDLDGWTGRYDLLLNAWTAFGYFDDETNGAVLAGMYERLEPGGVLVLELANKDGVLSAFDDDAVDEARGRRTVETRSYEPETSRLHTDVRAYDAATDAHEGSYEFDLRLYAPVELRRLCERVGFADVSLYAGLDGEPLVRESKRLVVVAER